MHLDDKKNYEVRVCKKTSKYEQPEFKWTIESDPFYTDLVCIKNNNNMYIRPNGDPSKNGCLLTLGDEKYTWRISYLWEHRCARFEVVDKE